MTTETTETIGILKWLATAEVRETPAPGREPAQPGEFDDNDDGDADEDDEEDQDDEEDSA